MIIILFYNYARVHMPWMFKKAIRQIIIPTEVKYFRDCQEVLEKGILCSGVYTIKPDHLPPFEASVYCYGRLGYFLLIKYFACKIFMQSKFRHQTLATKIGIGQCTLHKIFHVFNFHRERSSTKILTTKISRSTVYYNQVVTVEIPKPLYIYIPQCLGQAPTPG